MAKIPGPLSFLDVGDYIVGRFPLLCESVEKKGEPSGSNEGIIVWPAEGSREPVDQVVGMRLGIRVS